VLFPPHGSDSCVRSTQQHANPSLPSGLARPLVPGDGAHGQLHCFVHPQPVDAQYESQLQHECIAKSAVVVAVVVMVVVVVVCGWVNGGGGYQRARTSGARCH
jgi:hypothetical protein